MSDQARTLIDYIAGTLLRGRGGPIDEHTPLVSSGLIDSLAQTDLVIKLEDVMGRRFTPGAISPEDLETVATMIERARTR
jgi:acyl carrier protein